MCLSVPNIYSVLKILKIGVQCVCAHEHTCSRIPDESIEFPRFTCNYKLTNMGVGDGSLVFWKNRIHSYNYSLASFVIVVVFICLVVLITSVRVSKVPNYGHSPSI